MEPVTNITDPDIVDEFLQKIKKDRNRVQYKVRVHDRLEPIVVWESNLKRVLGDDKFAELLRNLKDKEAAAARRAAAAATEEEDSWRNLPYAELGYVHDPDIFSRQEQGGGRHKKKTRRKRKKKRKRRKKTRKRRKRKTKRRR